jgi:chemotaxis protein MotB
MAKKEKVVKDTAERWLLTYADLMNLLLIFFIILYAMSQTDQAKFNQLAEALREAFGTGAKSVVISQAGSASSFIEYQDAKSASPVINSKMEDEQMDAVKQQVDALVKKEGLQANIAVTLQERGVEISIQDKVLFNPGSAIIEPESKNLVVKIGKDILSAIPGKHIRIEGNTDSDPIKSAQFPTNWELSTARATNVLRLLVENAGLEPTKISAVGYGEFAPKVANDTEDNKAINRRVDIVILKDIFNTSEASTETTASQQDTTQSADTTDTANTSTTTDTQ